MSERELTDQEREILVAVELEEVLRVAAGRAGHRAMWMTKKGPRKFITARVRPLVERGLIELRGMRYHLTRAGYEKLRPATLEEPNGDLLCPRCGAAGGQYGPFCDPTGTSHDICEVCGYAPDLEGPPAGPPEG